ncbi:TRAF-like zinc finger [Pseudohyphozyma bogoriensis]|nr:TRAF-like zinc finger [Pseudohyphozyma bogoriensis]
MGYPTDIFVTPVPEDFLCSICLEVVQDATRICSEEHTFCKECVNQLSELNIVGHRTCGLEFTSVSCSVPDCKTIGTLNTLRSHESDCRALRDKIKQLAINSDEKDEIILCLKDDLSRLSASRSNEYELERLQKKERKGRGRVGVRRELEEDMSLAVQDWVLAKRDVEEERVVDEPEKHDSTVCFAFQSSTPQIGHSHMTAWSAVDLYTSLLDPLYIEGTTTVDAVLVSRCCLWTCFLAMLYSWCWPRYLRLQGKLACALAVAVHGRPK